MTKTPFDAEHEDTTLDHAVPADLIELHETMEWDAAIGKVGSPPNGPAAQ